MGGYDQSKETLRPMTLVIVWRLLDEEKFLLRNLQGYAEYCEKDIVACWP